MSTWEQVAGLVGQVPAGAWLAVGVGNAVLSVATWTAASRRMRRAGQLARSSARNSDAETPAAGGATAIRDTVLTTAALVPAVLFWAMVLAGSFHGLVAFGRQTLGWHRGWEYLVPGTLDGVSVTFAFLAFRAVRLQKSPVRCQRVVWGAAIASATVNFAYEYGRSSHNVVAGGYLALLSLFGMVMFHEFLNQFEEGTGYVKRENPAFGLRWLTWPTNTFCAAVAWRNYPPAEGTPATVLNAVANLEHVRALKAAALQKRIEVQHQRSLARTRRQAEMTAAKAGADRKVATAPEPPTPICQPQTPVDAGPGAGGLAIKVPATAATLEHWARTWVRMCADGDVGPINDKDSRAQYEVTARQLRNIRQAAISGALRRRANELGVDLPAGYADRPRPQRANGHDVIGT